MRARDRERRHARRSAGIPPKPRILVVTEGRLTEPQYLDGFVKACRNPRVCLVVARDHGTPRRLVEIAKELKGQAQQEARKHDDENLLYDAVWCVFDVDEHPKIDEAVDMARANGIRLAISNPCFELWLLLHFRDSPGSQHRHRLQDMMGTYVADYAKSIDFGLFAGGYTDAVARARRLEKAADEAGESGRCPTTGVFHLTEDIRGDGAA